MLWGGFESTQVPYVEVFLLAGRVPGNPVVRKHAAPVWTDDSKLLSSCISMGRSDSALLGSWVRTNSTRIHPPVSSVQVPFCGAASCCCSAGVWEGGSIPCCPREGKGCPYCDIQHYTATKTSTPSLVSSHTGGISLQPPLALIDQLVVIASQRWVRKERQEVASLCGSPGWCEAGAIGSGGQG